MEIEPCVNGCDIQRSFEVKILSSGYPQKIAVATCSECGEYIPVKIEPWQDITNTCIKAWNKQHKKGFLKGFLKSLCRRSSHD